MSARVKMADNTLLDEFCDALWLEDGLSRNTLDGYRRDLKQFQAWLEKMHGRDLLAATHADGSLITSKSPAKPGEVIVLYAGGLGPTSPEQIAGQLAKTAASVATPGFGVWLNGLPVSATAIKYAGITPGFAGLYQVNLELPSNVASPEVRIGFGSPTSPGGLYLPTN